MGEVTSNDGMKFTVGPDALRDYWTVYQASIDVMNTTVMEVVAHDPFFAPVLAAMTPEVMAIQQQLGMDRLRKGIEGDWSDYVINLKLEGARYAEMGVPFRTWYDLVGASTRALVPQFIAAFGKEPERLAAALRASQEIIDSAMVLLTETYLEAKQRHIELQRSRSDELEKQNTLVQEASRMKSEFLANMSHELRTPLNAIIGFSELIRDGLAGPVAPKQGEYLDDVLVSSRHLLRLINDVLDLAKVEAGRLELRPEDTDLGMLAKEVLAVLRPVAARKKISVELDAEAELPRARLDAGRMKQVLYNYLSNALKFTPSGGQVTVRLRTTEPRAVRMEVIDSGPGIAPADLGRLFRQFEQVGGPVASAEGTGLGLALTRRLVEAMGGSVGVASTVGAGSTFSAIVPLRMANGAAAPQNLVIPGSDKDAPRLLVIEDDPEDQRMLVGLLSDHGYAVETVATAAQALSRLKTQQYDGITLDLVLPDAPGLDILRAMRLEGPNKATPVIIVSVAAQERLAVGYAVAGVLAKPVNEGALREALESAGVQARGRSVMVVDDDPSSLRLAGASLAELGYESACYSDPLVALELIAEHRPSAIILDLLMPQLDGFGFLERLRVEPSTAAIPVFIWTVKDLTEHEKDRLRRHAKTVVLDGKRSGSSLINELQTLLPARPTPERAPARAHG